MALNYVALTITVQDAGQDAGTGSVLIAPTGAVTAAGQTVVSTVPVSRSLSSGSVTVNLVACDNTGTTPAAGFWAYQVTLPNSQPQVYLVNYSNGASQRLDNLTPAVAETTYGPAASSGGFASPMTTLGDIIYENSTPAAARLAGNTSATRNFLRQTGTGSASAAPAWDTLQLTDIPDVGSASGIATLDANTLVPRAELGTGSSPSQYAGLTYGAVWGYPWKFWPDKYGVTFAARVVEDATVTSGNLSTLTSATANFTSADIGRSYLCYTGSGWATGTFTSRNSSTSMQVSVAFSGAFANMGCVIATDDTAAWQAAINAAVSYAQGGPQEAELYCPPLLSGLAAAAVKGSGGVGGNRQLGLPTLTPGSSLACSLVMRSDGKSAGPKHWLETSHLLPGACLVSMRNDGSLDSTYGPPFAIGSDVAGMGGGNGSFSNLRFRVDGLTIAAPFSSAQYGGVCVYGLGQASVGDLTFLPLGIVPGSGPWPQFSDSSVSGYATGLMMPANGNNALCEIDQFTSYGTQISLIGSEHMRISSLRTFYSQYGLLPMSPSGDTMSHGISIQGWCCENVKYPIGSVTGGFFEEPSAPIDLTVARIDMENTIAWIDDPSGHIYGQVGFGEIVAPDAYITDTVYTGETTSRGVTFTRIAATPGLITSPQAPPASGSPWTNGYGRNCEITLSVSGGTLSGLLTDSSAETLPASCTLYKFSLAPFHTYTPTFSGTLSHTVKKS